MQTPPGGPTKPALATLGLSPMELAALATQGFVCAEYQGNGHVYHKLRFRLGGRQRVRYLGKDREFIDCVRKELDGLQKSTRLRHELGRLVLAGKHTVRVAKKQMEPLLRKAGFAFHGLTIRHSRSGGRHQFVLTEPVVKEENHEK